MPCLSSSAPVVSVIPIQLNHEGNPMTRDKQPILYAMLDSFLDSGVISEVMEFVKAGKEATVFRCRAGSAGGRRGDAPRGEQYYAAKVYRPRKYRRFRNDAPYQNGRVILGA